MTARGRQGGPFEGQAEFLRRGGPVRDRRSERHIGFAQLGHAPIGVDLDVGLAESGYLVGVEALVEIAAETGAGPRRRPARARRLLSMRERMVPRAGSRTPLEPAVLQRRGRLVHRRAGGVGRFRRRDVKRDSPAAERRRRKSGAPPAARMSGTASPLRRAEAPRIPRSFRSRRRRRRASTAGD